MINALRLAEKKIEDVKIVINGAWAAGIAICRFLQKAGAKDNYICNSKGLLYDRKEGLNPEQAAITKVTNKEGIQGTLKDVMPGADVFIGVSGPNCVTKEMVASMNEKAIVFPLANPISEIDPVLAKESGAYIVETGSSEYPNQINNVLVFPGLFGGAIDADARTVNDDMMFAAAMGIARCVQDDAEYILPYAYDKRVHKCVAKTVKEACIRTHATKADQK